MKSSPMKKSPFNMNVSKLSGLSPFQQIKEEEGEGKKTFDFSKKVDYSGTTPTSEAITSFITPQNKLELALAGFGGAGTGFGKIGTKLLKTKAGQKLASKLLGKSRVSSLLEPLETSTKAKQMRVGNVEWKKDIHVGSGPKVVDFKLNEMKSIGKNLDEINFDATKLTAKDVKFRGIVSGRSVVEVKLPTGQTQLFYKSTDYSGKGVEGMWQAYGGHADVSGRKGWFIKDEGFKDFYGSKSLRDISGNLDRIAVEGGFQKHITKGQGYASKK